MKTKMCVYTILKRLIIYHINTLSIKQPLNKPEYLTYMLYFTLGDFLIDLLQT